MSDQQETIELDDGALFRDAMSEPEQSESEQPRDEQGRFAAKEEVAPEVKIEQPIADPVKEPVAVEAKPEPVDDNAASVPSWRLREVREAREAAERRADEASQRSSTLQTQMQSLQDQLQKLQTPKAEPVDFFADPDQALRQRLDPIQSDLDKFKSDLRLEMSRELAAIKHGEPAVAEMEKAVAQAMQQNHPDIPALAARMRTSSNPASVAMDWHKNQKLLQETGGDLAAYKAKLREEFLKDPEFVSKAVESARTQAGAATTTGRPNIQLPPSLNKAAGSGLTQSAQDAGDMSDRSLFKHAMAR